MSLSSYSGLQESVAAYLDKTDLTARIPDFISLCEAKLRRDIVHEVGLSNTYDLSSITATGAPLPDDFNGVIFLGSSSASQPIIPFTSPSDYTIAASNLNYGSPYFYTIIGQTIFVSPSATNYPTLTLAYKVKTDLLKYGPNWLLEEHPDIYLYGTLCEAEPYILEDDRLPLWKALYNEVKQSILFDGKRQKYSGNLQMTSNGQGYT